MILLATTVGAAERLTFTFDDDAPGTVPHDFIFTALRQANAGTWEVRRLGARHYLAHAADPSAYGFALAVVPAPVPNDVDLTTGIRFVGGTRAGGLIWRYRDNANFYSAGVDVNRRQVWVSRVMSGNKVRLDVTDDLDIDPTMSHTLRVVHRGDQFTVQVDGIAVVHGKDRTFDGGHAGVWSEGAAEMAFTDIKIDDASEARR